MIELDLQSRQPIYEQLKARISDLVMSGTLKAHDQLPSVRIFARDLGINPNTVQKAYQDLERDGIIYSVSGKGSFISPDESLAAKLRSQYLTALAIAAKNAKMSGIALEDALDCIRNLYGMDKEGRHD